MIQKIKSWLTYFMLESQRWTDHIYRIISGLPTVRRSQITSDLYIGGQYRLNALRLLKSLGITGIVNMRTKALHNVQALAPIRLLHLPTPDLHASTLTQLQAGVKFIQQEIDRGGRVYIHCRFGEGRGPSMGIAYLISLGMTMDDALALIKKNRPFIRPTPLQLTRLKEYERLYSTG